MLAKIIIFVVVVASCVCLSTQFANFQLSQSKLMRLHSHSSSTLRMAIKESSTLADIRKAAAAISIALATWGSLPSPTLADRPLNAPSAAGTRVNSDAESLLRYGLPIVNKEIREIQAAVESAKLNLKTRRIPFANSDVATVKTLLKNNKEKLLRAVPSSHLEAAKESLNRFEEDIAPLSAAISANAAAGAGSVQDRQGLDEAFAAQKVLSAELSNFEELLVPDDFKRDIPEEYKGLPALQGRAEVVMTLKKADGTEFNVDGKNYPQVELTMIIDGYNAPLTGGNFVDLVNRGFYEKKVVTRSDGFVVQTGDADPTGSVHGFVPPGSETERKIPLEISLKGDKELIYGETSEDEGRGSAAASLPFQSYGTLGMARDEYEMNSASSQFFWLLFESDLTPAGKNLLDGRYTCFGYTVEGADLLKGVKEGDVIVSAKVTKGLDKLVK